MNWETIDFVLMKLQHSVTENKIQNIYFETNENDNHRRIIN